MLTNNKYFKNVIVFILGIVLFVLGVLLFNNMEATTKNISSAMICIIFGIIIFYSAAHRMQLSRLLSKQERDLAKLQGMGKKSSMNIQKLIESWKIHEELLAEQNQYIRDKADAATNTLVVVLLGILTVICIYFKVPLWIIWCLGGIILVQGLAFIFIYGFYEKKNNFDEYDVKRWEYQLRRLDSAMDKEKEI